MNRIAAAALKARFFVSLCCFFVSVKCIWFSGHEIFFISFPWDILLKRMIYLLIWA